MASLALPFLALGTFSALALIGSGRAVAAEDAAAGEEAPAEPAPDAGDDEMALDEMAGDLEDLPDDILDEPIDEPPAAAARTGPSRALHPTSASSLSDLASRNAKTRRMGLPRRM